MSGRDSFEDKVVLITGGTSGIGRATDAASYVTGHSLIVDGGLTAPFR